MPKGTEQFRVIIYLSAFFFIVAFQPLLAEGPRVPGKVLDLSAFKLTTHDERKALVEILPAQLCAGFSNQYFYNDPDGAVVFRVTSVGETTKGTHYPRTELRQLGKGANWQLDDPALRRLGARIAVVQVVHEKPSTVIGQIHGNNEPSELLKLRWTGDKPGACYVEVRFKRNDAKKDEYGVVLARGLSLGSIVDYTISMQSGTITVRIGDKTAAQTYTTEFFGNKDRYYFKVGNYLQYSGQPERFGLNKLYALTLDDPLR